MNPGDIYRGPGSQGAYAPPPGQPQYHQQQQQQGQDMYPPSQPTFDPSTPPVHSPHHTQSQPYPISPTRPGQMMPFPPPAGGASGNGQPLPGSQSHQSFGGGPGYGDPFTDNGAGQMSHHYPSMPSLATSPPPGGIRPAGPRSSLPQQPAQSFASPGRHQPPLEPPQRGGYDASGSYPTSPGLVPVGGGTPYSMGGGGDARLSSPPPLLPYHSNASSANYPPQRPPAAPLGYGHASSGYQDDDLNDSAPLLNHAQVGPGFGMPPMPTPPPMMPLPQQRYTLTDGGDVGVIPGRWDDVAGGDGGQTDGGAGYPMMGGNAGGNGYGHVGFGSTDDDEDNVHYGPLPTRMVRRNRTQKKVR